MAAVAARGGVTADRGPRSQQGAGARNKGEAPSPPIVQLTVERQPREDAGPSSARAGGHYVEPQAMSQPAIRVVIVENHQLVSESLGLLLDAEPDMKVVGKATTVAEALSLPARLAPDVVVMDYHLDDGTGRDAAIGMRSIFPRVKFAFLSRDGSNDARLGAVEAAASAYILKSSPGTELIAAIRAVAGGASLIPPEAIASLVSNGVERDDKRESLSPREREVLQFLAD